MYKHRRAFLLTLTSFFAVSFNPGAAFSGEYDKALWVDRLISETEAVIDEGDMPYVELSSYVRDTMEVLGFYGKDTDALRLEQKSRIAPDKPDSGKLQELATGLSQGDFVEQALKVCDQIQESSQEFALSFVAGDQARNGHFDTALAILKKLQQPERIKYTKMFIGNAYVYAGRADDAKAIAGDPPESDILSSIEETISMKRPSLDDPDYVNSMVRIGTHVPKEFESFGTLDAWGAKAEYLRLFHTAKYSAHQHDEANFLKHANEALEILNKSPERDWERLELADLYFDNGKIEEARSLYSQVINNFTSKEQDYPSVTMTIMLTSIREQPSAENIPHCFSESELKDMVNRYIYSASTWDMAAGLLALAIRIDNAAWADDIYQKYPLAEFKGKVARYVLVKGPKL